MGFCLLILKGNALFVKLFTFISACDLFGPQESHKFFIANVTNAHDKLCKHAAWVTSCWKG